MTREYREAQLQHLTQTIDGLRVILQRYKQVASIPAESNIPPGTTFDSMVSAILEYEFPRATTKPQSRFKFW